MNNLTFFLRNTPFFRIIFPFILGIALSKSIFQVSLWAVSGSIVLLFILLIILLKTDYKNQYWFGVLLFCILFLFGIAWQQKRQFSPIEIKSGTYLARVEEIPSRKSKSYQTPLFLPENKQRILAYISLKVDREKLIPGQMLFIKGEPEPIQCQGNPYEFDYKTFLARKEIGHTLFLPVNNIYFIQNGEKCTIQNRARRTRQLLLSHLNSYINTPNVMHLIAAIALGDRTNLESETKHNFSASGAMHILAVSGLHVGILFLIVDSVFRFLKKEKWGTNLYLILTLTTLWLYAFITGLSPSVLRATTMFSFVVIGMHLGRNISIYNSLAASAFFLLLYNPGLLFEIGFQLSYIAVISIVFFQPYLYQLFYFKFPLFDKIWALLCVSFAAQLGTAPLCIYYFHQFSSYFWLTNIFVIPLLFGLLYLVVGFFVTGFLPFLSKTFSLLLTYFGKLLIVITQIVSDLPYAILDKLYIQVIDVILLLLVIILLGALLLTKNKNILPYFLGLFFIWLFIPTIRHYKKLNQQKMTIFHSPESPLVLFTSGNIGIYTTGIYPIDEKTKNKLLTPLIAGQNLSRIIHIDSLSTEQMTKYGLLKFNNLYNFHGLTLALGIPTQFDTAIPSPQMDFCILQTNKELEQLDRFEKNTTFLYDSDFIKSPYRKRAKKQPNDSPHKYDLARQGAYQITIDKPFH